jgi:hypothetical protein
MTGGRTAPRLAAIVVGLLCGMLITGTGRAQGPDDLTGLVAEVSRAVDGQAYLERVARNDPRTFCPLLGRVLPMTLNGKCSMGSRLNWNGYWQA